MPKLSRKINLFTDSVIARMSKVAEGCGAINLSEGFPDFPPPKAMLDRLAEVAKEGPHQYSLDNGASNLRRALADYRKSFTGRRPDPETEIVVTCGGTEALMTAMMAIVDPGDKVILFSPFYEAYATDALLCGAEPIYVSLKGDDYTFDGDELEAAFKQRPKAIFICNPSNPCGKVFRKKNCLPLRPLSKIMIPLPSSMKSMNTSSTNRRSIPIFRPFPGCMNGPFPAAPYRRRIRLRAGG